MKKIINNKRYDTDTAKEVASYQYSNRRDFNFWIERLYRKRTGEFFLYGEGGASSKYAEMVGMNEWMGGEKIIPITYSKAKWWAEKYLDADEYENIFGEVVEDDTKKVVTFSLSADVVEKLKREVEMTGKTQSDIITELINGL